MRTPSGQYEVDSLVIGPCGVCVLIRQRLLGKLLRRLLLCWCAHHRGRRFLQSEQHRQVPVAVTHSRALHAFYFCRGTESSASYTFNIPHQTIRTCLCLQLSGGLFVLYTATLAKSISRARVLDHRVHSMQSRSASYTHGDAGANE